MPIQRVLLIEEMNASIVVVDSLYYCPIFLYKK